MRLALIARCILRLEVQIKGSYAVFLKSLHENEEAKSFSSISIIFDARYSHQIRNRLFIASIGPWGPMIMIPINKSRYKFLIRFIRVNRFLRTVLGKVKHENSHAKTSYNFLQSNFCKGKKAQREMGRQKVFRYFPT